MDKKKTIVVLLPVKERHKIYLESCAPGYRFVYRDRRQVTPEELEEAGIVLGNPSLKFMKYCKNLELLQLPSAGTDGYTKEIVPAGVRFCNSTGAYGLAMSEHMLGVTLQIMKNLWRYQNAQRDKRWENLGETQGIAGSTALVIGMGDIGTEYAKRFRALGGTVLGVCRSRMDKVREADEVYPLAKLDELLPRADVVALCVPGTSGTENILNKDRLWKMKKTAVLVNVGRGSAIDTDALYEVMQTGHLRGAGLDVINPEPLPKDHPLWELDNVLITPHVSGGYQLPETFERVVHIAGENVKRHLAGEEVKNRIDPDTGYTVGDTKVHFEELLLKAGE